MNAVLVKKIIGFTVVFLIAISIVFGIWRIYFYGTAIIVVEGEIDQTLIRLSADGDRLFPSGSEGREYILYSSTGSQDIQINGPVIGDQNISVDVGAFGVNRTSIDLVQIPPLQIGEQLVEFKSGETIDLARIYGEKSDWLLLSVNQNIRFVGNKFFIYRYSTDWNLIDSGVKVDAFSERYDDAPIELVNLLKTRAGD